MRPSSASSFAAERSLEAGDGTFSKRSLFRFLTTREDSGSRCPLRGVLAFVSVVGAYHLIVASFLLLSAFVLGVFLLAKF